MNNNHLQLPDLCTLNKAGLLRLIKSTHKTNYSLKENQWV